MRFEYQTLCKIDGTTWWTAIPERAVNSKYAAKRYAQNQIEKFNVSAPAHKQREFVGVRQCETTQAIDDKLCAAWDGLLVKQVDK
ncbi:MAG: hypothetical protein LWW74_06840 [Burkholderiales bacterium]|nr:hypothetical protein [Burkholderiales bacterium]